jgi:ferrous iron transport protein B
MKKIVLVGNPNVGKSVVFSRLTGAGVVSSNYPGTTVDYTSGRTCFSAEPYEIIDAPGTYSLTPSNKAEEVAGEMLAEADVVINVVDATNLERNLHLTLELLETRKPMLVALNLWDEATTTGIGIDVPVLADLLGVPVVPTVALSGEGIRELVDLIPEARPGARFDLPKDEDKWQKIGSIVHAVQKVTHRHPTFRDRLAVASIRPVTGVPLAIGVLILLFWLVRLIGETLVTYVFDPLFELYLPVITAFSDWLGPGILQELLIGRLIDGQIDFVQSLGLLTTGLYVPIAMVLPYILAFYLMLALLEDSGYLPRLSTLSDTLFHRIGMHGYGIVPLFLGLGCNVPGVLATRNLETRKQRFIAATLVCISVPCMAQIAMIFGVLGPYGVGYIAIVFATLLTVYLSAGLVLNRIMKGISPEICLEIPPYRAPAPGIIAKKTWMRVRAFLLEAIPYLFLGVFLVNVLYLTGFLDWLGMFAAPVVSGLLGLPPDAATALLAGFLRKDLAVGMLLPLGMSPEQLVIAITVLTIYFPCVATFAVLFRELGIRDLALATGIMIVVSLLAGTILRVLLLGV